MESESNSSGSPTLSFPRHQARTQNFTLGAPRSFTLSPDGSRVVFLRSLSGTDRVGRLWVGDVASGAERLVADPAVLLGSSGEELSAQERARRERLREATSGITGYATDRQCSVAAFALSGRIFVADLLGGAVRELAAAGSVLDPRPDPTGQRVAYVSGGALHVIGVDGAGAAVLLEPDGEGVTWGLAEFVAAEEMGRHRGFWWAPDGQSLLVARVDTTPVQRWWIADPEHPERPAAEVAYPAAGTPNADVRLFRAGLDGVRAEVTWDRAALPYLVTVGCPPGHPPLVTVQSRDQRRLVVLAVDPDATTRVLVEDTDESWTDVVSGVPGWSPDGQLVRTGGPGDVRRLLLGTGTDERALTPDGLQVDAVLDVEDTGVLIAATDEPTERHLWLAHWDGTLQRLTHEPGRHSGRLASDLLLVSSATLDRAGTLVELRRAGTRVGAIASHADTPVLVPRAELMRVGDRELRAALVLPSDWTPGDSPLPVLLDPYGGPHGQQVVAARAAYLEPQWLADQGFAVLVVDGRGTPLRGRAFERAVAGDLAGPPLEDQVDALLAVAADHPALDLTRVAIRGWSFGGYLAALAVLRRPDVFHAAVAGAPVTDWALYDTHYTERYLGTPQDQPAAYARSGLSDDAPSLRRPLLLIHGLADDNVVAAHTLRLSSALLAAGRPHTVLPLSGITHMTSQEVVAENLLLLQVEFLHRALASRPGD